MRRLVIKSLFLLLVLFTTVPVFATEADYDSNGVTAFYGKYEHPKEDPQKEKKQKQETDPALKVEETLGAGGTAELARTLPSYKGEGPIIPVTGDTSHFIVSLIGFALLGLVFFKIKEVETTEENSII